MEEFIFSSTGFILATLVTLSFLYYWICLKRPNGFPPGPPSIPILRGMYARGFDSTRVPWAFTEISRKYGPVFSLQLPSGKWTVVLNDNKTIREAFVQRGNEIAGRPFKDVYPTCQRALNYHFPKAGIAFNELDDQLKLQRNISMVVLRNLGYGKKNIEHMVTTESGYLVEAMKEMNEKPFSAKHLLDNAVANIISTLLFGQRYEYDEEEFKNLQHDLDIIFEYFILLSVIDVVGIAKHLPIMKKWMKVFRGASERMNIFADNQITELKKNPDGANFLAFYLKEIEKDKANGGKLEDRSKQLLQDFYGAGAETTATTLGWALYFMVKYPEVQEKVRNEITNVVGRGCRTSLKDREKLHYTEATICEILRTACTAPFTLPHYTTVDSEVGGYKIPAKTEVIANLFSVMHDPDTFPDPEILKPERFLDENGEFVRHEHFIPFSVGRRSCLGEQLARQELFLFFTHLIQSFEFKVPDGETLPPQKGLWAMTYRPPVFNVVATFIH